MKTGGRGSVEEAAAVAAAADSPFGDNALYASVPQNVASVLLQAANVDRKELILYNNSRRVAWISFISPASVKKGFRLKPRSTVFLNHTRTACYGIWEAAGNGDMQVQEITL